MNIELVELLEQFRQKAGAWQSQDKAEQIKKKLQEMLPDDEYMQLHIAHVHYRDCGEGTKELYDVAGKLISKYRGGGNPPSRAGKTFI